jgi:hypothetical protein
LRKPLVDQLPKMVILVPLVVVGLSIDFSMMVRGPNSWFRHKHCLAGLGDDENRQPSSPACGAAQLSSWAKHAMFPTGQFDSHFNPFT